MFVFSNQPAVAKKRPKMNRQQKAEIKLWKKRKDTMSPLAFKNLIEENRNLQERVQKLTEEVELADKTLAELATLEIQTETLKDEIYKQNEAQNADVTKDLYDKQGIVFKVQIGAYKKRNLCDLLTEESTETILEQERSENLYKYTLGHFRDYWKADRLKKELRALGLKDAWVVALQDGKRVPLKVVLEEVTNHKE